MELKEQLREVAAIRIQSAVRRFLGRCLVLKLANLRWEKVFDPRRKRFYYYETLLDASSWRKPHILHNQDLEKTSPTYTLAQACLLVQRQARRMLAHRRVGSAYKQVVQRLFDSASESAYYYNPKTGCTMWQPPAFARKVHSKESDCEAL
jgi:hypothetical protein